MDPKTKLLKQLEKYQLQDGEYRFVARITFLEYNEPIDPSLFALELPGDVTRIDQTTQEVGLAKGDLGDEEIAVKVTREFFEALISKDYAKAGQLYEGMPVARLKEEIGTTINIVRIISIGEPSPFPRPGMGLRVPYEIEIEVDGVKSVKKFRAQVRAVYNQPDRWTIAGGI